MKVNKMLSLMVVLITACHVIAEAPVPTTSTGSSGSSGSSSSVPNAVPSVQKLPIDGQDILRLYGLKRVSSGYRWIEATSLDYSYEGNLSGVQVNGTSAEDVLDKLINTEFRYRLTNPDDRINGYIRLYDDKNNIVFTGWANYAAADLKAGEKPEYSVYMERVPLLQGVESAEILVLGDDKTTVNKISVEVSNGQILLNSYYAGAKNGILSVQFTNGTLVTYSLASANVHAEEGKTESDLAYKIDGHHIFVLGEKPEQKVVKIIETWLRPTALITTGTDGVINFDVMGIVQDNEVSFERPSGVVFEQDGGPWSGSAKLLGNDIQTVQLPAAGKYRVRFLWNKYGAPGMLYTGPGKG